jgi:hypothetical protein
MTDYLDVLVLCSDPVNFRHTLNLGQELIAIRLVTRSASAVAHLGRLGLGPASHSAPLPILVCSATPTLSGTGEGEHVCESHL